MFATPSWAVPDTTIRSVSDHSSAPDRAIDTGATDVPSATSKSDRLGSVLPEVTAPPPLKGSATINALDQVKVSSQPEWSGIAVIQPSEATPINSPTYGAAALAPVPSAEFGTVSASAIDDLLSDGTPTEKPPTINAELLAQSDPADSQEEDPELGILRLQEQSLPPKLNNPGEQAQVVCENPDPELGCIRVKPLPPPPVSTSNQPVVYLVGRLDYFRSSNVFSGLDPIEDGLVRPGLTLFTAPALGPDTYFVGSIDGNFIRYSSRTELNYDELRFRAGIFQRLSPTMFGEIGWTNQQLFIADGKTPGLAPGTRFLNDHAIRLELSRTDQLANRLSLSTFYQLYVSFADPEDRSRIINSIIASLNYDLQPNLRVGLDYQFALADFTHQDRVDRYNQLVARLTYTVFRNTQLSLFGGYSFGSSSDSAIDFDGSILGVSLTVNLGLF